MTETCYMACSRAMCIRNGIRGNSDSIIFHDIGPLRINIHFLLKDGEPEAIWLLYSFYNDLFTADERQPWTNYENNGNEYLIIRAVVRSEYSNIQY